MSPHRNAAPRLALLCLALLCTALISCTPEKQPAGTPPEWVTSSASGPFDSQTQLIGKGSARYTGNQVADSKAARDLARSDLLSQVMVHVQADFFSRISDYRVGDRWAQSNQTVSTIQTSIAGTLTAAPREVFWTDPRTRQIYCLLAVDRAEYATSLTIALQKTVDAQRADLAKAEQLSAAGSCLESLEAIARVEASMPDYLTQSLSLRAVAGLQPRFQTPATPERIYALRQGALAGCLVQVEANADGHDRRAGEALAGVLRTAGMTVVESDARYQLTLSLDGQTTEKVLQPGWPGVAHARYGWRLTLQPIHGGPDMSIIEDSGSSPSRAVAHSGPLRELDKVRQDAVDQVATKAGRVLAERLRVNGQ